MLHVMSSIDSSWDGDVDVQIRDILGSREEAPSTFPSLVEEVVSDGAYVHEALYDGKWCEQISLSPPLVLPFQKMLMCMLECNLSSCPHLFHLLLFPSLIAIDRGLLPRLRVIELYQMNDGYRAAMVDLLTRQPPPQLEVVKLMERFEYSSKGVKPEAFMGLVGRLPLREVNMTCFPKHDECPVISPAVALAFARTIQQNNALRVLELSEGGFATFARGIKER